MKKKLFGNNIKPACKYCTKCSQKDGDKYECSQYGEVKSYDSCRAFLYDPLKRVPKKELCIANSDANQIDF